MVTRLKCLRCGHEWNHRKELIEGKYVTCPSCHYKYKGSRMNENYINNQTKETNNPTAKIAEQETIEEKTDEELK